MTRSPRVPHTELAPTAHALATAALRAAPQRNENSPGFAASAVNLVKRYGVGDAAVTALDGVTMGFPQGEITAIMGPSGSGKSTLLHCLAGLDTIDSGDVWFGDHNLATMNDEQLTLLRRERIGFVFQSFNLVPTLTARENILLPLELAGRRLDDEWFGSIIEILGIGDRLGHTSRQLSGGQQQRVAIARALATSPTLICADEPTGNLDSLAGDAVLTLLRDCCKSLGQTIVIVTHDAHAATYADQVVMLADGQIADEIASPRVDSVLETMRSLTAGHAR
ncbi:ABC transporter ATP-binding protein [Micrococcales bacterium 31B]|nr:ABC transporter ATP-binding protein [Micrococcales bacterium 31B]